MAQFEEDYGAPSASTSTAEPRPSRRVTQGLRAGRATANLTRVLVAGDSREHRAHIVRALERDGCEVVEFLEWPQLVDHLRRLPLFDVIGDPADVMLLDLRMSGRPLLDRVVAITEDRVPILIVVAAGMRVGERANWLVIEEPFDAEDLRQAMIRVALLGNRIVREP